LGSGAVHLYFTRPERVSAEHLRSFENLLDAEERARLARLSLEKVRREYLLGRALVRTALGRHLSAAREALRFSAGPHGKPLLIQPTGVGVDFNLAHTEGLLVAAVTFAGQVGVDVEPTARPVNLDIADRYFAPSEIASLRALPQTAQVERFLTLWTLKEAYLKATGVGISGGLSAIRLEAEGDPVTVAFDPSISDDPVRWRFWRPDLGPAHRVAVALCGVANPPTFQCSELIPEPG
jgi:4'-phosphopantetheinyl transferase